MPAPKIPETVRVVAASPLGYEVINLRDFQEGVHERYEGPVLTHTPAPVAPAAAPEGAPAGNSAGGDGGRTDLSAVAADLKDKSHRELQAVAKGYGLPSVGLTRDALVAMIEDHRKTLATQG